jgi:hypothetical protein
VTQHIVIRTDASPAIDIQMSALTPTFPETHNEFNNRPYYHPLNPHHSSKSK